MCEKLLGRPSGGGGAMRGGNGCLSRIGTPSAAHESNIRPEPVDTARAVAASSAERGAKTRRISSRGRPVRDHEAREVSRNGERRRLWTRAGAASPEGERHERASRPTYAPTASSADVPA